MRNVVKALRELLVGGDHSDILDATDDSRVHLSTWNHLKDLAEFWNRHVVARGIGLGPIRTEEKLLKFRAPHSDTETICRELGFVHFANGNVLEVELEASHQLATIRYHLPDSSRLWLPLRSNELYLKYLTRWVGICDRIMMLQGGAITTSDAYLLPLISVVLGDDCLLSIADGSFRASHIDNCTFEEATRPLVYALLSTCWGEGRRRRLYRAGSGSNIVSATDAVLTNDDARISVELSNRIAKDALRLIAINFTQHGIDRCGGVTAEGKVSTASTLITMQLLCWVLQEGCADVSAEDISGLLVDILPQSLFSELVTNPAVLEVVRRHPDGALLQRLLSLNYSFSGCGVHLALDPTILSRPTLKGVFLGKGPASDEPLRWMHMARLLLFVSKRYLTRTLPSYCYLL